MFIAERLTSRSSVALSVSIGYARSGAGRGTGTRSRGPDEEESSDHGVPSCFFPHTTFLRDLAPRSAGLRSFQKIQLHRWFRPRVVACVPIGV